VSENEEPSKSERGELAGRTRRMRETRMIKEEKKKERKKERKKEKKEKREREREEKRKKRKEGKGEKEKKRREKEGEERDVVIGERCRFFNMFIVSLSHPRLQRY